MDRMTTTVTATSPSPHKTDSWAGVASLGLGIFAIIMSEFLPASLLPRIASGLGVTEGQAGQAVSVTAFSAAAAALFISAVLPRADRRSVMIGLTLLAIVSNVIVALAPNLAVLLAARVLVGIALGGFWAMATAMAAHLVHADHVGRALTVINSGVAVATIAAVPLGAWLGELWGWRGVFFLAAGVAAAALIVQASALPHVQPAPGGGLRALGSVLRSGAVLAGLFALLLVFSGHFSGFTYIRVATDSLAHLPASAFAVLLLVYGLANFAGTAVAGPLADRAPRVGVILFPAALGIGMVLMHATGSSPAGLFITAALWSFGFGGVPTTFLSWGARVEPTRLEQIGGVIVTVCNLAIAVGSAVGGAIVDSVAADASLLFGGIAVIAGALVFAAVRQRRSAL
jgi:DHA1 family purine ribonucleoside efflux pump-like MFS transporter